MGLSLRLFSLGGDILVPANVRPALARLYTDKRPTAEPLRKACRFGSFGDSASVEFPHEFLFLLRRLSIRKQLDPTSLPEPVANSRDDRVAFGFMDELLDGDPKPTYKASALCNHGHDDGVYLPVPLAETIWEGEYSIGSSVSLLTELSLLGDAIGLPDDVALDAWFRSQSAEQNHAFYRERYAYAALVDLARLSLMFGTALVFS
jgi:hypothetical protein